MRKLQSLVNIMNDPNSSIKPANLGAEGIGVKDVGFAQFSSSKKRKGGTSFGTDGFAEIANKKKHSQSTNIGEKESQVRRKEGFESTKTPISPEHVPSGNPRLKPLSHEPVDYNRDATVEIPLDGSKELRKKEMELQAKENELNKREQAKNRRFKNDAKNQLANSGHNVQAQSGPRVPTHSGTCIPTQSGEHVATQSGPQVPTKSSQSGLRVSTKSAHQVPDQPVHIPTQSAQSFPTQSQSRPNLPRLRGPSQSRLHSPVASRQHTSQSAQSSPNQSRQLTAQSRQHTPESHSQQRATTPQFEHSPPQSRPSTLNVSSTAANENICWNIGSKDGDGRERIEVINEVLEPSNRVSAMNRQIMYEQLEPTGYNWKSVSKSTQDFYFEEFKKYFVWRQSDAIIYNGWLANAKRKYSELVSNARSDWEYHNKRDNRVCMNVYLSWIEFWKTTEFKKKSTTQKNNRRSGDDGLPSTHTSGSASHRVVAARMKMQYKCDPTADELFKLTHTKRVKKKKNLTGQDDEDCEDGEEGELIWIDKKSQRIYETFLALLEQQEKVGPVDRNARNALFLQATGGPDKKKRVYGLGSSQNLFYKSEIMPCTSFANEENQRLQEELKEVKDRMKAMESQLAMLCNSVQCPQPPADLDNQSDDNSM